MPHFVGDTGWSPSLPRQAVWQKATWAVLALCLALLPDRAGAELPLPVYPACGSEPDQDVQNCPNDFGEPWEKISYVKSAYYTQVRPEERAIGTGIHLDRAFAVETGDWAVTIASLDSGIEWDEGNLRRKFRLNTGELPLPRFSDGSTASSYDLDQDGLVTVDDYAQDPRVSIEAGNDAADDRLDPSDLIYTFSDGLDSDGNGYVDDICGWDFFWNDNDPFDDALNQGYSHGTIQLRRSGAEGGDGGSIGSCPNCAVMMLRSGDSFISETSAYAQAIIYAVDNGANVVQIELGALNASSLAREALDYAWAHGVTVVASAADEASIHANLPAALHHAIVVHPITFSGSDEYDSESFLVFNNCSDFGGRPTMVVSDDGCSSEATAVGSGLAGLMQSASLHTGLALTANEIYQIFIHTVDDVWVPEAYYGNENWYPSKEGFDRYFGYGRVNIRAALDRVFDGTIPPEADLLEPDWFQVIDPTRTPVVDVVGYAAAKRATSFHYVVEWGPGLDPEPQDFRLIEVSDERVDPVSGVLAHWDVSSIPASLLDPAASIPPFTLDDDNVTRMDKINTHTVTLRVRVIDDAGLEGEMRKTLYLRSDPDLLEGYPLFFGASLESSPKLVDMDGDGVDEVVVATSDGWVHLMDGFGQDLPGWPVRAGRLRSLDPAVPGNHAAAPAYRSGAIDPDRPQSLMSTPAIGDLDGDGRLEVVVTTFDGEVFAWRDDGTLLAGFPVSLDRSIANQANAGEDNLVDDGFMVGAALGDLDGDGKLDIVAAAMDQHVYVWNWRGQLLPGWPVKAAWPFDSYVPVKGARINTAPAVGDVNGDGLVDVVVSTAEIIDFVYAPTYAIHGDGNLHRGGPFLRGWPIKTLGLYANLLPTIGTGSTSHPVLADIDGDGRLEVATHTVAGHATARSGSIFRSDGSVYSRLDYLGRTFGALSNADEPIVMPLICSGAFGDLNRDGSLDYTIGLGGGSMLGNLLTNNRIVNGTFSTGAFDATSGKFLPGFPQVVADMQFFVQQVVADIDGDGYPESISSNGAFTVHAFDYRGEQPEGWPKLTGQWGMGAPAVGDVDGDGYLEVFQGTRSGYLYAWRTQGRTPEQGGVVEWGSYQHDPANTGNYETQWERARAVRRVGAGRR